jgi:hypothetical protein
VFAIAGRRCASIGGAGLGDDHPRAADGDSRSCRRTAADVAIGCLMPMAAVSKASTEPGAEVTDFSEYHLFFSKDLDGLPELGHLILSSASSVSSIAPFWLVSPRKSGLKPRYGTVPQRHGTAQKTHHNCENLASESHPGVEPVPEDPLSHFASSSPDALRYCVALE